MSTTHPLPLPDGESRKDPTTGGRVRGNLKYLCLEFKKEGG